MQSFNNELPRARSFKPEEAFFQSFSIGAVKSQVNASYMDINMRAPYV